MKIKLKQKACRYVCVKTCAVAISSLLHAPGLHADTHPDTPWPVHLRVQMARLTNVAWRLRKAAQPACQTLAPDTGIRIDVLDAYDPRDRPALEQFLGMTALPQIAAVAPDSPAAKVGLRAGDQLVSINGTDAQALLNQAPDRALGAEFIEQHLRDGGAREPLFIELLRSDQVLNVILVPTAMCRVDFILKTDDSRQAYSDGKDLAITTGMIDFAASDDQLALIAGHELAHAIYGDEDASGLSERRRMEDRADVVGGALTACAGYDLNEATDFWRRWRKMDWLGFLRLPTHRSASARIKNILTKANPSHCPLGPRELDAYSASLKK